MNTKEEKAWRSVGHKQRFVNAFRGIYVFWKTTNEVFRAVFVLAVIALIFLGVYFKISNLEWVAVLFSVALVVISEALNTAIEIDIDLTSPEYHPYARDTKDVAAGAVILSVIFAAIVGAFVFLPKIF